MLHLADLLSSWLRIWKLVWQATSIKMVPDLFLPLLYILGYYFVLWHFNLGEVVVGPLDSWIVGHLLLDLLPYPSDVVLEDDVFWIRDVLLHKVIVHNLEVILTLAGEKYRLRVTLCQLVLFDRLSLLFKINFRDCYFLETKDVTDEVFEQGWFSLEKRVWEFESNCFSF